MISKTTLAQLALAGMVPSALAVSGSSNSSSGFNWGPCEFAEAIEAEREFNFDYECSNFSVPLDYLDESSDKTINLQLSRVHATNGESQGSIFFNFGGPGLQARITLIDMAEQILTITEGKYDLVAWDPRGTTNAEPFKCYNDTERVGIMEKHGLDEIGGPDDKPLLARVWAGVSNLAGDCATSDENAPEMGELIGTGYVARDLITMHDALVGEDTLLKYWGMSYGTVLGATVAALFPERIGRVLLDANVNLPEWYDGWEKAWWTDSDNAVYDFFERCVNAGPELCSLAERGESADELNDNFYGFIDELRTAPIPLGGTEVLDNKSFKTALRMILYGPTLWPTFADVLSEVFRPADDRNVTAIAETWIPLAAAADATDLIPDESGLGIFCGDKKTRTEDFEKVFAVAEELDGISKALGDLGNGFIYPCARWPFHAKGAYEGSWRDAVIETENPILFSGNTYDPVSPVSNAHNSSVIFQGAGVLEHGGIGHGLLGHASVCTAKAVRAYFHEGTLPDEDLACEADYHAFDLSKTWKDSYLPELGWD